MNRVAADADGIARAAQILRHGGLVAFPTETVYGLAALWGNIPGVNQLRAIKGRDANKPFQLLIPSPAHAGLYAEVSPAAQKLLERFFPGPLTLVLPDGRGGGIRYNPRFAFKDRPHGTGQEFRAGGD